MKPLNVIGGGLAGLSLGIALRGRGLPVTVHEAGNYPRHRVCGEFICGVDEEALDRLGIGDLLEGARQLRSTVWYLRDEEVLARPLPMSATGLSRYALDLRLARRFQELGGDLRTGQRYRLKDSHETGVVRATGRVTGSGNLVGLKMHLRDFPLRADLEMHFAPGGYCGISAVEDGRVNLCGLFRKTTEVRAPRETLFLALLEHCGLRELAHRIRNSRVDPESHCAIAGIPSGYCRTARRDEPCSVGDHFGMMGPFTGNGMSMAFESALAATDPLEAWIRGRCDWSQASTAVLQAQRQRFFQRLTISQTLHGLLLSGLGLQSVAFLARSGLLPFRQLFRATR